MDGHGTQGLVRTLLGLIAASLALLTLAYGDAALSARAIPAGVPGRENWVYGSALLLLGASAGLGLARTAWPAALAIASYLLAWTASYTPQVLASPLSFEGWYGFCEALTALLGAWIVCVLMRWPCAPTLASLSRAHALRGARILFGLMCVFYGASHLAFAEFTASMVPAWLPARLGVAYATGIAHMAAGMALICDAWALAAATLEACMMALFGLLVWVPSFFAQPRPAWAAMPQTRWSELVISAVLAASAGIVAGSMGVRTAVRPQRAQS